MKQHTYIHQTFLDNYLSKILHSDANPWIFSIYLQITKNIETLH